MEPRYPHYGWFMWCPIYVGAIHREGPCVEERWWVPEWWFWFNEWIFGQCCMLRSMVDEDFEPEFPLKITGEIKRD